MILRLLFLGVLCGWLMPLHLPPWVSWHSESIVFAVVILASGVVLHKVKVRGNSKPRVVFPVVVWPVIALFLVVIVQTLQGTISSSGSGVVISIYLVLSIFSLWLGFNSAYQQSFLERVGTQRDDGVQQLAGFVLTGGVLSVLIAIVQALDAWDASSWIVSTFQYRRPGGNMGQPNHLATLSLLAIASAVFLFETGRMSQWFAAATSILLLMGLALSESRAGLVSFSLLVAWWLVKRKATHSRIPGHAVSAGVVVYALSLLVWPLLIQAVSEGGLTSSNTPSIDVAPGSRLLVWPQLLHAVEIRPWFGWGLGEVAKAHNAVLHDYANGEPFTYAHNILLDLAIGIGIPLTLSLIAVLTVWIVRRVKFATTTSTWYCVAALIPIAVHSLFEFPFAYAYFLVPVFFLIGSLEAQVGKTNVIALPLWVVRSVWAIFSIISIWSAIEYIDIEEDYRVARFEALRLGRTPDNYASPSINVLNQLNIMLKATRVVPSPGMPSETIEVLRVATLHYPWTAIQNRYALALALNGNPQEAIRQLKVMKAMHGEATYAKIKTNWIDLGVTKFAQLQGMPIP